ncbi:MAG: ArsR/SmtB family transcription factor [Thermodesulfobacteriota bacterium]
MSSRYYEKKAAILKALAQPTRLRILDMLKAGERCVCEMYPELGQEQPNISKHLGLMKQAGILESRKEGLRVIYWIKNPEALEILRHAEAILKKEAEENQRAVQVA